MRTKAIIACALIASATWASPYAHAQAGAGAPISIPGFLKLEAYTGITGTPVQNLLDDPKFPNSPDQVHYMTGFDTRSVFPSDALNDYGARITGFITPTESGEYEFFLRSDDASQLFLSTDETEANLVQIAEETSCCGAFEESGAPETSAPIALTAGKRYLIRALYKEGGGGDFCQVAWRKAGDTTASAQLTPISSAYLSVMVPAQGQITITQPPANQTVAHNDVATFSVDSTISGGGPLLVQWQKNGVTIPGKTGRTLTLGPVQPSDNGAKIHAVLSIPGATVTSADATLTVTADVTKPSIRSLVGSDKFDKVTVEFSEAVTSASAGVASNYTFDGGLTVSAATVLSPTKVQLTTSKQTMGATYNLTIKNITDTAGNSNAADAKATLAAFDRVPGGLKFEAYKDISSTAVQSLLDDPKFPDSPDEIGYVSQFTSRLVYPDSSHENYGGRISGWIVPKETGQYEFFLRSDDASQLFLSTDETRENATMIAEETGCCGAFEEPGAPETSAPISMTAGKRYYIEALWKEGGGGDYCDVAWRKVGDTTAPRTLPYIPGNVLETLAAPGTFTPPTVAITNPEAGSSFDPGTPVTITPTVSAGPGKSITKVEYFEAGKKLGESTTSPFSITLVDLSEDAHAISARATDSAGIFADSAVVSISVGGQREKVVLLAIDDKTMWKYDRSGQDLGTEWRNLNYNDSQWPQGKALIADETTTTVEPIRTAISRLNDAGEYVKTFYFRAKFNFAGAVSAGVKLQLRHVVDDGAVFYLNGTEIHRFGIAAGPVDATTDASGHENVYEGPYDIPSNLLVTGENILTAEVHQSGGSSSDMVFGAELIATVPVVPTVTTLIAIDDKTMWRYDRSGQDLGAEWKEKAYNDSAWPQGKTLIADETTTTVEPIRTAISRLTDAGDYIKTFYFRTHFTFPGTSTNGAKLKLRHVVDDGVIFYLNGVEIHRFGIAAGPVDATTDASGHENVYEGPYDIPLTALTLGDNVLAAEVHQSGGSSSDMVFGAELIATTLGVAPVNPPTSKPTLTIASRSGNSLRLEWTGTATLQSADSITGPWADDANAKSPFTANITGKGKFYRLKQ